MTEKHDELPLNGVVRRRVKVLKISMLSMLIGSVIGTIITGGAAGSIGNLIGHSLCTLWTFILWHDA